jgi:putative addiction module component (TIGR02574 family)
MIFAMSLNELVTHVMALPSHTRAYLAEALLESLDFDEDFLVSAAWLKEIENRCNQLDVGALAAIPADKLFAELRAQLGT